MGGINPPGFDFIYIQLKMKFPGLLHALEELLSQLFGKLVVGIDLWGFLVVLHHIHIVTLTILGFCTMRTI